MMVNLAQPRVVTIKQIEISLFRDHFEAIITYLFVLIFVLMFGNVSKKLHKGTFVKKLFHKGFNLSWLLKDES